MSDLPNKVTLEALTDLADSGHTEYNHLAGTLTHCTITLPCGFQVTGESACIDPANYNEVTGQEIARKKAVNALWPLEGYLLANDRYRADRKRTDKYVGEFIPCTAPADPDHELTEDEVATLASNGSLCDCCYFEADGREHPIKKGDLIDFGTAIHLMRLGKIVMRTGWNGKNMYTYHVPAASYPAERNNLKTMGGKFPNDMVPYGGYIALKTASGEVVPWTVSQTDLLAEDWQLA